MSLTLNLDSETQAQLNRIAEAHHRSPEAIASEAIQQFLEKYEHQEGGSEGRHPSGKPWPRRSPVGGIITPV